MRDNRLAYYILLYAGIISLSTLVFAYFGDEKLGDKALTVFNNVSLGAVSGILGYLTAKNENNNDDDETDL